MRKISAHSTATLLFSIACVFLSGCTQTTSAITPSLPTSNKILQTPVPKSATPTFTVTPLPCMSLPKEPTTELEKVAEKWFLSSVTQIPERSQYEFNNAQEAWSIVCSGYQRWLLSKNPSAYSPIEISLQLVTQSVQLQYFLLDNVIVAAVSSEELTADSGQIHPPSYFRNIVTVVLTYPYADVYFETRNDYVFENDIWQIRWWGTRWKCINNKDAKWNTSEEIACP